MARGRAWTIVTPCVRLLGGGVACGLGETFDDPTGKEKQAGQGGAEPKDEDDGHEGLVKGLGKIGEVRLEEGQDESEGKAGGGEFQGCISDVPDAARAFTDVHRFASGGRLFAALRLACSTQVDNWARRDRGVGGVRVGG